MPKYPFILSLALATGSAAAQSTTTVGVGLDYVAGKYGESERSTTWTVPVIIKHESGATVFKLTIPYVRATGTASAGGDRFVDVRQTQSGLGDVVAGISHTAYFDRESRFGIDVGGKIKFATADKAKTLLTSGKTDYSLQADVYRSFGETTPFATLGWTRKGDPEDVDYRNPWYFSLGFGHKVSAATTLGIIYDYRQRLTPRGDPISEATLFATHAYSRQLKIQGYAVVGFSEASPDAGLGAVLTLGF